MDDLCVNRRMFCVLVAVNVQLSSLSHLDRLGDWYPSPGVVSIRCIRDMMCGSTPVSEHSSSRGVRDLDSAVGGGIVSRM